MKKIFFFILNPYCELVNKSFLEKTKDLLKIICIYYLLIFLVGLFSFFIPELNNYETSIKDLKNWSTIHFFLILVILTPFIEESIFRLPMVFKPINLVVTLFILIFVSGTLFLSIFISNKLSCYTINIIIASLLTRKIYFLILSREKKIYFFGKKYIKHICYLSIVTFSGAHLWNYNFYELSFLYIPILILPQVLSSIILTFLRLRYGFVYCLIFHSFINFILLLI